MVSVVWLCCIGSWCTKYITYTHILHRESCASLKIAIKSLISCDCATTTPSIDRYIIENWAEKRKQRWELMKYICVCVYIYYNSIQFKVYWQNIGNHLPLAINIYMYTWYNAIFCKLTKLWKNEDTCWDPVSVVFCILSTRRNVFPIYVHIIVLSMYIVHHMLISLDLWWFC